MRSRHRPPLCKCSTPACFRHVHATSVRNGNYYCRVCAVHRDLDRRGRSAWHADVALGILVGTIAGHIIGRRLCSG
jgi:hypothetical protein